MTKIRTSSKAANPSALFSRSRAEGFDYFLKGSKNIRMEKLADMYKGKFPDKTHPLNRMLQALKDEGVFLDYSFESGMFYGRIVLEAEFLDGGLFCAAGGNFYQRRGVWVWGKQARAFLCESLKSQELTKKR